MCLSDSGLQCNKTNSFIICVEKDYLALLPWNNKMHGIEGKEVMLGANLLTCTNNILVYYLFRKRLPVLVTVER